MSMVYFLWHGQKDSLSIIHKKKISAEMPNMIKMYNSRGRAITATPIRRGRFSANMSSSETAAPKRTRPIIHIW